jgi:hypothetical protein
MRIEKMRKKWFGVFLYFDWSKKKNILGLVQFQNISDLVLFHRVCFSWDIPSSSKFVIVLAAHHLVTSSYSKNSEIFNKYLSSVKFFNNPSEPKFNQGEGRRGKKRKRGREEGRKGAREKDGRE